MAAIPTKNSAWQQGILGEYRETRTGLYVVDASNPNNPKVTMQDLTKFTRQYFKFIRRGAVRIEASSDDANLDPLAFVNTDSSYVVVVKAEAAQNFSIQGLPAGAYGIKHTTSRQYNVDQAEITISAGEAVSAGIPAPGVITVYTNSI
jgi:hypothetical protein